MTRLLTAGEAATVLGCSTRTLMARVRRGEIACIRTDVRQVTRTRGPRPPVVFERAHTRFRLRDLEAWIAARYQPAHVVPAAIVTASDDLPVESPSWERRPASQRRFS